MNQATQIIEPRFSTLANLTYDELEVIWDAVSQFSENRLPDDNGDEIEHKPLESVEGKLDSFFANIHQENKKNI
jgi:hypothetical protein